ncbi:DgyrCDS9854 [Dimorphilus gyrociliatus]|uniref:DgyrCDS9854 n=1 Tax=Dimorphilus gyrociliatus TaxID=2664684 RepID=A0A7I8W0Y6_9ANNE|nr:DgyrCDS9854 [Dimorphilus gyrociliatus]
MNKAPDDCGCKQYVSPKSAGYKSTDDTSTAKRALVGSMAALGFIIIAALIFMSQYYLKKREMKEKKLEVKDGEMDHSNLAYAPSIPTIASVNDEPVKYQPERLEIGRRLAEGSDTNSVTMTPIERHRMSTSQGSLYSSQENFSVKNQVLLETDI